MKVASQVVRDWQLGWVLRYQSGALIQTPYSNNQLNLQLARSTPTFWNYVPGVNRLNVDPNCGCFNPQTTLVLNKNAWTDAPPRNLRRIRAILQRLSLAAAAGRVIKLWKELPHGS